jgi:hypothetical protein
MFGIVEREFSRHLHVDLAGALQAPFQPLRRDLVLDALAGRIRRPADRTERFVEVGDRLRRETGRALLHRTRDAIDFNGIDRPPLTGAQSVGSGGLGGREKQRRSEHRHCILMSAARMTFAHLSISHLIRSTNSLGVLAIGSKPSAERRSRTSGSATTLTISRYKRSTTSGGVPAGTSPRG